MTAEETKEFGEIAKAVSATRLSTLIDRKAEIVELDYNTIEKMKSLLAAEAANNGICGLGCLQSPEQVKSKLPK